MATKKSTTKTKKVTAKPAKATRVTTVKAVEASSPKRPAKSSGSIISQGSNLLNRPITSAAIAEFVGTFLLASTVLITHNEPFYLFITFTGLIMIIGGISGAHLNPAITLAAWISRRINWVRATGYIVAQVLAAMLAVVVMNAFLTQAPPLTKEALDFGQTPPTLFAINELPEGKEVAVFFAELIGLAILGFAYASILRPSIKNKLAAAFTIGGTSFVAMAFASTAATYVKASVVLNPAVGVTVKAFDFANMWTLGIYIGAAVVGAVVGFFLHDLIKVQEENA